MAQAGYTPIQIYYSTTTTNAPSAGNLTDGELAINTADGKLFYKDNLGVVQIIASISFGSTGLTPSTATTGAVTVAGTLAVGNGGTGLATTTAYGLIAAGTTATGNFQQVSGTGSSGQVLTSNGAGALPSWQTSSGISTGKSIAMAMIFGF
jgi:hypothetical protein